MKERGVQLHTISIQSEPDHADEWIWWTSEECVNFIANYTDKIDCIVNHSIIT